MPGPYPLDTLSVIIDASGITAPPFEDIYASLIASYQKIYGSDTYLAADSQDGQWIAVQAQAIYDTNQALIAGYLAYSPAFAQGIGLSSVIKINGIQRLSPTPSTAALRVVGQAGTVITNGIASDDYGFDWALPPNVVIPLEGEILVTGTCMLPGAVKAAPGTINNIVTAYPGWQTVSNTDSAFVGNPVEMDATLRKRQARSTALPAITPRESLYAAVANVRGVGRVAVHENDSDFYDIDEVPPHTVSIIVEGGDSREIAEAITLKKNTGCGTFGDSQYVVFDAHGVPNPVNWFYLDIVPVYVTITIQPLPGYLETTGKLIVGVVAAAVQDSEIGEEVYAPRLYAHADLAGDLAVLVTGFSQAQLDKISDTYVVRDIRLGTTMTPMTDADVIISFKQAASCNASNVTLQVTPR